MATLGNDALADLLKLSLADLAQPGRSALASVAVMGDTTGFWMSGAEASSAFHIGSVTKTMTALLLATMSVQHRVELTDPLDGYLKAALGSGVRLVDLATHTAGYRRLPRRLLLRMLRSPADPYAGLSDRDVDRALVSVSHRIRGDRHPFAYSNFGYGVLSRALAVAGGDSFANLLHSEVLTPLGLVATTMDLEEGDGRVAGHDGTGRVVRDWHNPSLPGCGCLWSTIEDVHTYLRANLSPRTSSLTEALELVHLPREPAGPGRRIGLGWLITDTDYGPVLWHNGGTSGFAIFVGFNSERQLGVAIMASRKHEADIDAAAMSLLAVLARP